ncbi:MAG: LysE family translocator [Paracoccaceae bacterium]
MIIELSTLLVFIPIALALNLTPGADMMFCLAQGTKSGPKAGIAASFGIATGSLMYTLAGAFGLASLIATHPIAYEIIRWGGVAYLCYLAIQAFLTPLQTTSKSAGMSETFQAWKSGVFVSLMNPKIAIFILALIPQFIDPSRGAVFTQFLIFGGILNLGGTLINAAVGGSAGKIGTLLVRHATLAQGLQYLTGCLFLGLAAKLALGRS